MPRVAIVQKPPVLLDRARSIEVAVAADVVANTEGLGFFEYRFDDGVFGVRHQRYQVQHLT